MHCAHGTHASHATTQIKSRREMYNHVHVDLTWSFKRLELLLAVCDRWRATAVAYTIEAKRNSATAALVAHT